jgi:hypothetical protein
VTKKRKRKLKSSALERAHARNRLLDRELRAARSELMQFSLLGDRLRQVRERNEQLEREVKSAALIGEEMNQFTMLLDKLVQKLRQGDWFDGKA